MSTYAGGAGQGGINLAVRGVPKPYLSQFLSTEGDGTGDTNANGNYLGDPTEFFITPQDENEVLDITRLIVQIADTGSVDAGSYGNGITLVNGININLVQNGETQSLTEPFPIFTNGDWAKFCYDVNTTSFGSGLNYVGVRWTFSRGGTVLRLRQGDRLAVALEDNLSGLVSHTFLVQGNVQS